MSRTNSPNMTLTSKEMSLLKAIYTRHNLATHTELREAGTQAGMSDGEFDLAVRMLIAQEFMTRNPRPRTAGGYVYSIALKAMKKIRAENAASKASDRQHAVAVK